MATTLTAVVASMKTAIAAVSISGGGTWTEVAGAEMQDDLSSPDRDNHFQVIAAEAWAHAQEFGVAATAVIRVPVSVLLFRDITSAAWDGRITLIDDAIPVAHAVEKYASYPAGTDVVLFDGKGQIDSDPKDPAFVVVRLNFFLQYQATY